MFVRRHKGAAAAGALGAAIVVAHLVLAVAFELTTSPSWWSIGSAQRTTRSRPDPRTHSGRGARGASYRGGSGPPPVWRRELPVGSIPVRLRNHSGVGFGSACANYIDVIQGAGASGPAILSTPVDAQLPVILSLRFAGEVQDHPLAHPP